jgi:hypothetical protein
MSASGSASGWSAAPRSAEEARAPLRLGERRVRGLEPRPGRLRAAPGTHRVGERGREVGVRLLQRLRLLLELDLLLLQVPARGFELAPVGPERDLALGRGGELGEHLHLPRGPGAGPRVDGAEAPHPLPADAYGHAHVGRHPERAHVGTSR